MASTEAVQKVMIGFATTKRAFLGMVGAALGGHLPTSRVPSSSGYSETVDIVEAGADNTGGAPINDVLEDVADDDTLVKFPPGSYLLDREFDMDNARHVGFVGTHGSTETTFLIKDSFADENVFDFGSSTSVAVDGLFFKGFTVDLTTEGAGAGVLWAYCRDGCHIEDVVVTGAIQGKLPSGKGEMLMRVDITQSDGTGLLKGVSALDGAEYAGTGQPATGIYVGGAHAGTIEIESCAVSGFQDNGLYTSAAAAAGGRVVVRGGRYANNDVANVRIGGATSLVEDVTIVQDSLEGYIYDNPRGLWARNGECTVRNLDITYGMGDAEPIQLGDDVGDVSLENIRIHQTTNEISVRAETITSSFTADGLTVVAEGTGEPVLIAEGGTAAVKNSCFEATDGCRDGLLFTDTDAHVSDSTVNVSGTAIDGATTENISYEGTCSPAVDPSVAVSTSGVLDVTGDDATVEGALNDLGGAESVDVGFEYREVGDASWQVTPRQPMTETGTFSAMVDSITSNREYEVRAIAEASDGDVDRGSILSFVTEVALVVVTEPPTDIGAESARLVGNLRSLGDASSAEVAFEYREVGVDTWTKTAGLTLTDLAAYDIRVTGLDVAKAYEYRAVATASDGDFDTGMTVALKTASASMPTPEPSPTANSSPIPDSRANATSAASPAPTDSKPNGGGTSSTSTSSVRTSVPSISSPTGTRASPIASDGFDGRGRRLETIVQTVVEFFGRLSALVKWLRSFFGR